MTLGADLTALLAGAGITDADVDEALADEHLRLAVYRRVVAAVAAGQRGDDDRVVVAAILRDPDSNVAKTAVVDLVDSVAMTTPDPTAFRQWATTLAPEPDHPHREFLHRRTHDWTVYLTIAAGRTVTATELAGVTDWMQRVLATESTSSAVLALLADMGNTKKIRNSARNRAHSHALRNDR